MNNPQRNIVLMGFMGTGKSAVGRTLAHRLNMTFLDMDATIEKNEGKSISRIFAEDGEPRFRALERGLVQELAATTGHVIACGGGIVLNRDNITDFARTGLVICLTGTPQTIYARVKNDTHRPLLAEGDKLQKITDLLAKRAPHYAAVPHQVATDGLTLSQVTHLILDLYHADDGHGA